MKKILYAISSIFWGLALVAQAQNLTLEQAIHAVWENSAAIESPKIPGRNLFRRHLEAVHPRRTPDPVGEQLRQLLQHLGPFSDLSHSLQKPGLHPIGFGGSRATAVGIHGPKIRFGGQHHAGLYERRHGAGHDRLPKAKRAGPGNHR